MPLGPTVFCRTIYMILSLTTLPSLHLRRLDGAFYVRAIFLKLHVFVTSKQYRSTAKIVLSQANTNRRLSHFKIGRGRRSIIPLVCESLEMHPVHCGVSRKIRTSRRCEIIAIFIDTIWAASVKPGLFPVRNQRTDFGWSLSGTCSILCFSCTLSSCRDVMFHYVVSVSIMSIISCTNSGYHLLSNN